MDGYEEGKLGLLAIHECPLSATEEEARIRPVTDYAPDQAETWNNVGFHITMKNPKPPRKRG